MNESEFREAMQSGLGRAILYASDNDVSAFRLIETGGAGRESAIAMLDQNWRSGDHEIVLGWFEREEDREVRHGLGMDLRNFWKKHPNKATEVGMLLTVYENSPCSECREFALTRLIKLKALPKHIREECAYDSNETIRELIAGAPQVP